MHSADPTGPTPNLLLPPPVHCLGGRRARVHGVDDHASAIRGHLVAPSTYKGIPLPRTNPSYPRALPLARDPISPPPRLTCSSLSPHHHCCHRRPRAPLTCPAASPASATSFPTTRSSQGPPTTPPRPFLLLRTSPPSPLTPAPLLLVGPSCALPVSPCLLPPSPFIAAHAWYRRLHSSRSSLPPCSIVTVATLVVEVNRAQHHAQPILRSPTPSCAYRAMPDIANSTVVVLFKSGRPSPSHHHQSTRCSAPVRTHRRTCQWPPTCFSTRS